MPTHTHGWISLWFLVSIPVVLWDSGFIFLRPRSMPGGDLHWPWKPYAFYMEVDYIYGLKALHDGDGFPAAQSLLNIIELVLQAAYLFGAHAARWPAAPLVGFTVAALTLWKTLVYMLQEAFCGGCMVGQNDLARLIVYWVFPNGCWIVVPSMIVWTLGKDLVELLHVALEKTDDKKTI